MQELRETVTAAGLTLDIPREVIDELGWREGQEVTVRAVGGRLTVAPVLTPEQRIRSRAFAFLNRHVGDATQLGQLRATHDGWEVPVSLSYTDCALGVLCFSNDGELIPEQSTSPEAMRRAANAA
jgi:antitoxin component of MazEF toxin-antitoxin module